MSELVFGKIGGGGGADTLVFIPAERARDLGAIHIAIATATTWRQFARMIPAQDCLAVLHNFSDDEPPAGLDDNFERARLPGFEDCDWPDWVEREMMLLLPAPVCRKFGVVHQSVLNGPFMSFDPKLEAEIVVALESTGFACRRDTPLILRACGSTDFAERLATEVLQ